MFLTFSCSLINSVTQNILANPKNTQVKDSWCIIKILVFSFSLEKVENFMYQENGYRHSSEDVLSLLQRAGVEQALVKKNPNYPLNLSFVTSFTS